MQSENDLWVCMERSLEDLILSTIHGTCLKVLMETIRISFQIVGLVAEN
jgi:hypothetical protein